MILSQLLVSFFRNIQDAELFFSPRANIILGDNGQGKTNLLEAIHVLSLTKSFRTHQSSDLINWKASTYYIKGEIQNKQEKCFLSIQYSHLIRRILVNDSKVNLLRYLGLLTVSAFSTIHVEQFKSDAEIRRRTVDRGLYPIHPSHLRRVLDYGRLIKQKNSLLREGSSGYNKGNRDLLDSWNLQIADLGARIIKSRQRYIDKIKDKLNIQQNWFTPETLTVQYLPSFELNTDSTLAETYDQILEKLSQESQNEFRARRSLVGPHLDQILMLVNGKLMQRFGSAGQQRCSLLAYQLAQMEVHFDVRGEYPIFLMDDADAELDEGRTNSILNVLESKTQVFITTNKPSFIRKQRFGDSLVKTFKVEEGQIKETSFR